VTASLRISKVEASRPLSAPRRQNSLSHRQLSREERRGKRDKRERGDEGRWRGGKREREEDRVRDKREEREEKREGRTREKVRVKSCGLYAAKVIEKKVISSVHLCRNVEYSEASIEQHRL
jgi:hypothetical protein